ncbi:MAG TPA: hypothetical protein VFZ97_13095 [Acidimicrobiales bacterium]
MSGILHIQRDVVPFADWGWKYLVDVDDETRGDLEEGEAKDFFIAPGYHNLRLHAGIFGSNQAKFFVDDGARVCFLCRPRFTGLLGLMRGIISVPWRTRWIALRPIGCRELEAAFPQ